MKVLANDGISESGRIALEKGGFDVITTKVAQEQVANYVNANNVSVVLVRSATKVRKDINEYKINHCSHPHYISTHNSEKDKSCLRDG